MSHEAPKATLNINSGQKISWTVSPAELKESQRETRSCKPEVLFSLGQKEGGVITKQVQSPLAVKPSAPKLELVNPVVSELSAIPPQPNFDSVQSQYPAPSVSQAQSYIQVQPPGEPEEHLEEEGEGELEDAVFELPQPPVETNQASQGAVAHPQGGVQVNPGEIEIEGEELESDSEMSEERTIAPSPFSGSAGEDGDAWLRHFENYCTYKGYEEAKTIALFKVLLTDAAAVWLDALTATEAGTWAQLKAKYTERYKTPEIMKYKSAREIFSRRQRQDESVEDFISYMRKLARTISVDDKITGFAILNGLKPDIAAYVTQQKPANVEEILQAARIAELTSPQKTATESVLSDQLTEVQTEVKRLSQKWDKLATASVADRRSPSPAASAKRVTFDATQSMQEFPRNQGYYQDARAPQRGGRPFGNRGGGSFGQRGNFMSRPQRQNYPSYPTSQNYQNYPPSQMGGLCQKCGQQNHTHPNYCKAINKMCNYCGKRGHFSKVCRAAMRARGPLRYD